MNKLSIHSQRSTRAKKIIFIVTAMSCLLILGCMSASAMNVNVGAVNYTNFINKVKTVLEAVCILLGAGLAIWGAVNLLEGYGNDNPGAKSQGMKQVMGGVGVILTGVILVPVIGTMMTDAMNS